MDEQRLAHPIGFDRRQAERPIVLEALGALHPVEDELALRLEPLLVEWQRAQRELVAHVR